MPFNQKLWHYRFNLVLDDAHTIDFEGINCFNISWGSFTEDREHVQEVFKTHVTTSIFRENLTDAPSEWIFL